jgi:hypothetical protein
VKIPEFTMRGILHSINITVHGSMSGPMAEDNQEPVRTLQNKEHGYLACGFRSQIRYFLKRM